MSSTLDFARNLIRQPSVTPDDAGCQDLIAEALQPAGFKAEFLTYGEVRNVWLRRGQVDPLLVFAGHTDVVPTGPIEQWHYPPFSATVQDGILHGRGAADMKGSLAAMVTACQQFVVDHPNHRGSIALLITSDEEGPANNGTVKVVEKLCDREEIIDWCVVGEPTSREQTGDVIKNGRRGSLGGKLTIQGVQGHVAYPHLADNPIHRAADIVTRLAAQTWDEGNEFFPPTTFQVSNLNSGTGASNVIPAQATLDFNLRYSPESSVESIKERVNALCQQVWTDYEIDWSTPN